MKSFLLMSRTSKAPNRKLLGEKEVAKQLIGDFKPEGSRGMTFLEKYFNKQLYVNRISSLGQFFSHLCNIKFPRNYKRNKTLLILWFDKNIDAIEQVSPYVNVVFEDLEPENE